MSEQLTDKELLAKLAQGDTTAVDTIFRQHYASLCLTANRVLRNTTKAEDLVQDVFFELWRKRKQLHIHSSLAAYLKRATMNKALNYIRDEKIKSSGEEPLQMMRSKETGVQRQLEASELKKKIDQAIDELPERCRLIFCLSRFEEMSYQEIANELDLSIKTVENQITKALRLLRQKLGVYLSSILLFIIEWLFFLN
ncbi:MAG: RNA polymerase sigma-70 factor [Bacteroidota bacterium]